MSRRRALFAAVAVSVLLHAVLLLNFAVSGGATHAALQRSGTVMQAKLLPAQAPSARERPAPAPIGRSESPSYAAPPAPVQSGPQAPVRLDGPSSTSQPQSQPALISSAAPNRPGVPTRPVAGDAMLPAAQARIQATETPREAVAAAAQTPFAAVTLADRSTAGQAAPYHDQALLDPPPRALYPVVPAYPASATARDGSVILRLRISAAGRVEEALVLEAAPPGLFEASAVAAFRLTLFSPGYLLGVPVASELTVQVDYNVSGQAPEVSGALGGGASAPR